MDIVGRVIAYGSLMDRASLQSSVGEVYGDIELVTIPNLRRSWMAGGRSNANNSKFWILDQAGQELMPIFKPCYLDVTVEIGEKLIAPAVPVTDKQLAELDRREVLYDRVKLSFDYDYPMYIYVAKPCAKIRAMDDEAYIPYPYHKLCMDASKAISEECGKNYLSQCTKDGIKTMYNIRLGDGKAY